MEHFTCIQSRFRSKTIFDETKTKNNKIKYRMRCQLFQARDVCEMESLICTLCELHSK